MTKAEIAKLAFPAFCTQNGIPRPETEWMFAKSIGRKWRFDYSWPIQRVALECDGGVFVSGRHTRGSGWMKDTEKINCAASMGWRMLRCTPAQLNTPEMLEILKTTLLTGATNG